MPSAKSEERIAKIIAEEIRLRHPNFGSKFATPASRLIDHHYSKLLIYSRWTWERYARLAVLLKLTPYELGSVVGIPHSVVEKWKARTTVPIRPEDGGHAIGLILTILEGHVLAEHTNDVIKDPFPNLAAIEQQS